MSALATPQMLADAARAAGIGGELRPGPAALASPSYRAVESLSLIGAGQGGAVFVKLIHPEMRAGYDMAAAMQLARQAGEVGAGPRVLWSDAEAGAIAMQALLPDQGWAEATQFTLQRPAFVAGVTGALKRLHGTAPLAHRFDPFAQIDAQLAALADLQALPEDAAWLRRLVAQIEPLAEGAALAPCRNDGSASNLMAGPQDSAMLVDFDRAGMNDPLYDIGALMTEVSDFPHEARAVLTAYLGHFDEAAFARARLWSAVDDMLHGLWSRRLAQVSARRGVEWLKYGEWRLMRLRLALNAPDFEQLLRLAKGEG